MYPTEEQLQRIRTWNAGDFNGLMEFIRPIWEFQSFHKYDGDIYRLATGGWSGNEDIIGAMQDNQMFWLLYWAESRRGGLYIFAPYTIDSLRQIAALRQSGML